ncbi:YhcN/YlaJ family sporulation lipoprotein [Salirhabdus euzebyi]|uniref:YhcN/YlaJ family sporulation lipoprotein n=1 Tax=Salirhabdus euzebyi TaxID=394506 RepID=A0A841PWU6_9BACI|nr:YhcN/YlaJ family sporulation lipoprotein [Salirhabdus euzebyi]MBB6451836.1 YhcN/YlaJ family sporulation lipoprotein [Salirhabdus euzebyi]
MNKLTVIGATFITAITLAGCQGGDDTGLGDHNQGNLGVEPTRYNENIDIAPNRDRIDMDEEFGPDYYQNGTLRNDEGDLRNDNYRYNREDNGNGYAGTNYNARYNDDANNNGITGNNTRNNNTGNNAGNTGNNHNQFEVADRAADRITSEVEEVERAYVFTGPENAYVAAVLDGNQNITDDIEQRIRQAVKATDEDIDDVFVSTNPDFINQAGDYTDQVEAGEPIEGFFDEMGDMFRRVFPTNDRS